MNRKCVVFILLALAGLAPTLMGSEKEAPGRIVSVGLFKNGLALVNRVIEVPESGTYCIADVPEPVHGSFWMQSTAQVTARVTWREEKKPMDRAGRSKMDLQEILAGREVEIHLRGGELPPVTGVVEAYAAQKPKKGREADLWADDQPYYRYNTFNATGQRPFLLITTREGLTFLDPNDIVYIRTKGEGVQATESVPVLEFQVGDTRGKPAVIQISYLAKGLSWAPSYCIDLENPDELEIEQKAVIRNELTDLKEAEVFLISGFPSVSFSHVRSPFSAETSWVSFFRRLGRRPSSMNSITSNVVTQQAVMWHDGSRGDSVDLSALPLGDGVDLHYQPAGRMHLEDGESLILSVDSGKASYERIVEWIVPDNRDYKGRYVSDSERRNNPEKYKDSAWDAVLFRNPFAFPMTTAPAMVVKGDRFLGQRTAYWTNAGEKTALHINKALSIRTLSTEQEDKEDRRVVHIGGCRFHETKVTGSLRVANHRAEAVKLLIRRRFSGELISADGEHEAALLEEGVYSINRRNELTWTITLPPGGEKSLSYRYSVLVYF